MSRRSFTAFVRIVVDRRQPSAPRGSRPAVIAEATLSVLASASAPASASDVLITNIITNAHKAKLQDDELTNNAVNMIDAVQT